VRLALVYARLETIEYGRYTPYSIPAIALPAVLMLLFGHQVVAHAPERMVAGFAATALITVALFQFGVGIAMGRVTPWERYVRTLPATAATRVVGRILSALVFAVATVTVVMVVGMVAYGAGYGPWRFAALILALLLGSVPFGLGGIALGYWLPPRSAMPIANIVVIPLVVVGFLWTPPPTDFPRDADLASQLFPTRSWAEVLDAVSTGDHPLPLHHVAALAVWTVVFFALARWGYRRDEGEQFG
jgi:ABC-2 type transport system permease protein